MKNKWKNIWRGDGIVNFSSSILAIVCGLLFGFIILLSSNCVLYTSCVGVAQLDRAFGYGPKGREFESSRPRLNPLLKYR